MKGVTYALEKGKADYCFDRSELPYDTMLLERDLKTAVEGDQAQYGYADGGRFDDCQLVQSVQFTYHLDLMWNSPIVWQNADYWIGSNTSQQLA